MREQHLDLPAFRECLDHIIIFNEHHLRGVLAKYLQYHHKTRTHALWFENRVRRDGGRHKKTTIVAGAKTAGGAREM
jgi:hypothetical protein